MKQRIAWIVSFLLHPQFLFPLCLVLPFWASGSWSNLAPTLLLSFVFPFGLFLHLYRTGRISDWDITHREERRPLYLATMLGAALSLLYLFLWAPEESFLEILLFFLALFFFGLINRWIKISIHMGVLIVTSALLIRLMGFSYWIYLLALPLAWSRLELKRHKPLELLLGATVPLLIYEGILRVL